MLRADISRPATGKVNRNSNEYETTVSNSVSPVGQRHNHAKKKTVKVGLQTDSQVEVIDPELRDGDQVVTVGNRELADEMQVKVLR